MAFPLERSSWLLLALAGVRSPVLPNVIQLFGVRGKSQMQVRSCQRHLVIGP